MKTARVAALALACGQGAAMLMGDGTISTLSNNHGATIYPIFDVDGVTGIFGTNFKVEVFTYDSLKEGGFGLQLGSAVSPAANLRFNAGSSWTVPGTVPGDVASLIVRAWNESTGLTYDSALIRGASKPFTSDILGGDPDGPGPLEPIVPKSMTTGLPTGFQSFSLIGLAPPGTLSSLANSRDDLFVPVFKTDGTTPLTGDSYKIEVLKFDPAKPGGFGKPIGDVVSPDSTGRFNAGNSITIPGSVAGIATDLIVRAWDATTGVSYDLARVRGASTGFKTGVLGGDPDGSGPLPPITPGAMLTGAPDGFQSFSLLSPPVIPGPGTIAALANSFGSTIVPVLGADGRTILTGLSYKVEVYVFDAEKAGGFGRQLGATVSPAANGRFNAGNSIELPESTPGATATVIVRGWDATTGETYDTAKVRGVSAAFATDVLGGDPDGDGPLPPAPGKSMTSGTATGFHTFSLVNLPSWTPGGGTVATLSNNAGSTIFRILNVDGTWATGPDIKVEVFIFDASKPGGFGTQLGQTVSPASNGRFNAGSKVELPYGGSPGTRSQLIVRAWDVNTGETYESAYAKGDSGAFWTDTLGGDPDGDGPLLPITPKSMTSGSADGFQSFTIGRFIPIPEPTTIALGALGAVALGLGRRRRAPEPVPGA